MHLSEAFKEYLKERGNNVFYRYRDVIFVHLWNWGKALDRESLSMDEDLLIKTKEPLTQRDMLHLTIHVPRDFSKHQGWFFTELVKYPGFVEELISQYQMVPPVPRVSIYIKQRYADYLALANQGHRDEDFGEYLARIAKHDFFKNMPLDSLGVWHHIALHLLFGCELSGKYKPYLEYFCAILSDVLKTADNIDDIYTILVTNKWMLWVHYRDKRPDLNIIQRRQQFFGNINIPRMRKMLILREHLAVDDPGYLEHGIAKYQQEYYLSVIKRG